MPRVALQPARHFEEELLAPDHAGERLALDAWNCQRDRHSNLILAKACCAMVGGRAAIWLFVFVGAREVLQAAIP
jgi:hypothetical protein